MRRTAGISAGRAGSLTPAARRQDQPWERYNRAYLQERYVWAERLLCMVVAYGHELEPHIAPQLRPVWDAALTRA